MTRPGSGELEYYVGKDDRQKYRPHRVFPPYVAASVVNFGCEHGPLVVSNNAADGKM